MDKRGRGKISGGMHGGGRKLAAEKSLLTRKR